MTMTLIEHIPVGSGGETSIAFDSLPTDGTYDDLLIVASLKDSGRGGNVANWYLEVNDLQTSIYSARLLRAYQGTVHSSSTTNETGLWLGQMGVSLSDFGSTSIYLSNYASAISKAISVDSVTEKNAAEAAQTVGAGLIGTSSAISKVRLYPADSPATSNGTFAQYSTFTIYGITAGSSGGVTVS